MKGLEEFRARMSRVLAFYEEIEAKGGELYGIDVHDRLFAHRIVHAIALESTSLAEISERLHMGVNFREGREEKAAFAFAFRHLDECIESDRAAGVSDREQVFPGF